MSGQKINVPMLGGFLGLIAAVAAGLLAFVYVSTQSARDAAQLKVTDAALSQVLPEYDEVKRLDAPVMSAEGWPVTFYVARLAGNAVGVAGEVTTPEGFNGNMTLMVGLNLDGSVRTVVVIANTETPGLGTVITDRKVQKTIVDLIKGTPTEEGLAPNIYLDQYAGKTGGDAAWAVKKDGGAIDAKTGATITSRAVCGAVYSISRTFVEHSEKLGL
jgi:Na+-translocating ferredoxin:NAD+ oxidoreductase subunit G